MCSSLRLIEDVDQGTHLEQHNQLGPVVVEVGLRISTLELDLQEVVDNSCNLDVENGADVLFAVAEDLSDLPGVPILRNADVGRGTVLVGHLGHLLLFAAEQDEAPVLLGKLLVQLEDCQGLDLVVATDGVEGLNWLGVQVSCVQLCAPIVKLSEVLYQLQVILAQLRPSILIVVELAFLLELKPVLQQDVDEPGVLSREQVLVVVENLIDFTRGLQMKNVIQQDIGLLNLLGPLLG